VSESLSIELHNRQQAWAAIRGQLFPFLAQVMQAGGRWVLTVTRRKRTPAQNRRYWGKGVLAQIAEQAAPGGKLFDAETWHEQFKRQFIGVIEMPDGREFCKFSDKVEAFAASELGVTFYDLQPH
jgi:hypothetical protein